MSGSDFKTVLVKDATISDVTPDLTFAVESGASSTTYQRFISSSPSNSSVIFSVQVPSESIVCGRDVLLQSGLTFNVRCTGVPVGAVAFQYGVDSSLAPFPLASVITTASSQINNTTVSINLQDILPQILTMNSKADLAFYNGMTPSLPDGTYGRYADAVSANNNPLAAYEINSFDDKLQGRGSFPVSLAVARYNAAGVYQDQSLICVTAGDYWSITISTIVTEPLFLSPFTWGNPEHNAQGLVGLNNMTLTLNIDGSLKRLFSTASPYFSTAYGVQPGTGVNPNISQNSNLFTATAQVGLYSLPSSPALLFKFLSTQPSDRIESKNVVPYTDFPRYLTPNSQTQTLQPGASGVFSTQNIQINQMPSKIMIVARKPMALQNATDSASFLTITGVSVNLNNASGLLSSSSQQDLWRISTRNGSNQTWEQFSGQALRVTGDYAAAATGTYLVPTGGSMLVLNPVYDLSLPDYLSCGSLGNFNLQLQINVTNQFVDPINPEFVVVCVNDGILTTVQGVSSTYTGILTRQMVMDAKQMVPESSVADAREIGGRLGNMSKMRHRISMRRMGGAPSGGAMSGGAMKHSKLSGLMKC